MPDPTKAVEVTRTLAWVKRKSTSRSEKPKKLGVTPGMIARIVTSFAAVEADLKGLRSALLCVLGYAGLFRISELLSVRVADISFEKDESIVTVHLHRAKNDQDGRGSDVVIAATRTDTCPLRLLKRYMTAAGSSSLKRHHFLLRNVKYSKLQKRFLLCNSNKPLTYTCARQLFRECIQKIGEQPDVYSLHMLRKGAATAAIAAGVSERAVQRQGRWRSKKSMEVYIQGRKSEQFPISKAIGL
jgi:integrase